MTEKVSERSGNTGFASARPLARRPGRAGLRARVRPLCHPGPAQPGLGGLARTGSRSICRLKSAFQRLSTVLIVAGIVLLGWGLMTLLAQRPTATEQAALARGRVVSQQMEVAGDQVGPVLLPAPADALAGSRDSSVITFAVPDIRPDRPDRASASSIASGVEAVPTSAPTAVLKPEPEESEESLGDLPSDVPGQSRPSASGGSDPAAGRATPARTPAQSAPTRIVAPTIGLDSPVVEVGWQVVEQDGEMVSVWEVADYAAGFHKSSAYPGNPGNTVLSGHHNIKGEVFRHLVDLAVGAPVYLYAEGRRYAYRVVDVFILQEAGASLEQRRKNAQWIAPTPDERLTLVTCWPYWANTHRVIVIAEPAAETREPAGPEARPRVPLE